MSRRTVTIGDQELVVSNLDKVLYPATGFTKAAVLDYYVRVADAVLPHLRGRPLTMKRYPDGVESDFFFEKRCPDHRPDFVHTVELGREGREKVVEHCSVDDVATLAWVANLASIELHTSLGARPDTFTPTMVVFDLDPGPPADVLTCADVALLLRQVFDRLGLVSCVKTSGGKGLQVYVPVNTPTDYNETKNFALSVGQLLERVHPDLVLTNMTKSARSGKVFVDWSQNTLTKTTVCAYSLRAEPTPTASTPVTWAEVEQAAVERNPRLLRFQARHVIERVEERGDLFAPVLAEEQTLPELG